MIANISGTDHVSDKLKTALSTAFTRTFDKKLGELWSTSHSVNATNVCSPKINSARDFGQLYTSIANVSGTDQDIDNRKSVSRRPRAITNTILSDVYVVFYLLCIELYISVLSLDFRKDTSINCGWGVFACICLSKISIMTKRNACS